MSLPPRQRARGLRRLAARMPSSPQQQTGAFPYDEPLVPAGVQAPVASPCCMAATAECLPCSARRTPQEHCLELPQTPGCDQATDQVVNIMPQSHPGKCFAVSHVQDSGQPGMRLKVQDCPEDPRQWDEFVVPLAGHIGPIKSVKSKNFCLQGGIADDVSFQPCDGLPLAHMLWMLEDLKQSSRFYHIHLAADASKCLDSGVSSGSSGQSLLKVQECQANARQENDGTVLLLQPSPVDCVVEDWSQWSRCSQDCGGQRSRSRIISRQSQHWGRTCGADLSQREACSRGPCPEIAGDIPPHADRQAGLDRAAGLSPWWLWFVGILLGALLCWLLLMLAKQLKLRVRFTGSRLPKMHGQEYTPVAAQEHDAEEVLSDDSQTQLLGPSAVRCVRPALPPPPDTTMQQREVLLAAVRSEMEVQTKVVVCPKRHVLEEVTRRRPVRWRCDGRSRSGAAGVCPKASELGHHACRRYRCEICDFDLCEDCCTLSRVPTDGSPSVLSGRSSRWRAPESPAHSAAAGFPEQLQHPHVVVTSPPGSR